MGDLGGRLPSHRIKREGKDCFLSHFSEKPQEQEIALDSPLLKSTHINQRIYPLAYCLFVLQRVDYSTSMTLPLPLSSFNTPSRFSFASLALSSSTKGPTR